MSRSALRFPTRLAAVVALGVVSAAQAAVYKCKDSVGKTMYSDTPCDSRSKPLKLPDEARGNVTDPHMCEQLLDEITRLTTEAQRSADTGRAQGSNANRRKALSRQYEKRCVGISRSK
jgi:hypothetical protein